jgi:hypothetical protein
LSFAPSVRTDAEGRASLTIAGTDPGNPRGYVDGQIYQLNYRLPGPQPPIRYPFDQIVVHLRSAFPIRPNPSFADIRDSLVQFGNLYPLMSKHLVDLGDQTSVLAHRDILLHAFRQGLDAADHMPVTRDLSDGKLQTIIRWLEQGGDPPVADAADAAVADGTRQTVPTEPAPDELLRDPAITITRSQYDALTTGEGGKIDALRGVSDSIDIIEDQDAEPPEVR